MTIAPENLIRSLPLNREAVMFSELDLAKYVLEKLFESDEAQLSKEELLNDLFKIVEVSERIKQAETPLQRFDIYYSEYRPLSDELRAKYSDFSEQDTFREIETYEKYMDGLNEFIVIQGIMLLAFEDEIDKVRQCGTLYTGIVRLSDLVEEYLLYFPQGLIECIRNIAIVFLSDSSLKPDKATQNESVFSYLIGLKNTARAILWQIEEHLKNGESRLTNSLAMNPDLAREMQIQKNQAAINWAKSQLEEVESIGKAKGYKL